MKPGSAFWLSRLSGPQIKMLCILAKQAHPIAKARFDPRAECDVETWRKRGQEEATGIADFSLSKHANQGHFLIVRGYWFTIIGDLENAFYDFLNAGAANEARKQMAWRLMGHMAALADGIAAEKARVNITEETPSTAAQAWAYTQALSKDKFQGRRIDALQAYELEQLCHTVLNRANAKLGKGRPEDRNKKQRQAQQSKKALKAAESASSEPFERPSNATAPTIMPPSSRAQEELV